MTPADNNHIEHSEPVDLKPLSSPGPERCQRAAGLFHVKQSVGALLSDAERPEQLVEHILDIDSPGDPSKCSGGGA